MQPVKRSPRPRILQRRTPAFAAFAALLALAAVACDRGGALPRGGAHGASASQALPLPPPVSGVTGVPGAPGEAPPNELMPRSQSVSIGNAAPAPLPGARHRQSEESGLAARERRLAERQAALEARERRLSRQSRAAAASVGILPLGGRVARTGE